MDHSGIHPSKQCRVRIRVEGFPNVSWWDGREIVGASLSDR